jgi:Glycosyl transferase family 90
MMDKIPLQDISWSQKKNQAIFRGTLTGLLPPTSRFKLSTRNSHASVLTNNDAEEKCLELDRCRLVYQINRHYNKDSNDGFQKSSRGTIDNNSSVLVDAKLVLPQLQHTDMPMQIHNVPIYGNRMTKQDLMSYKVIIMLEGNDAGTGLKWALFSNSVVMTNAVPQFSSWLMEEWLQPWVHYIPLDLSTEENLAYDIHEKMEWILNHDVEAQNIARRGALWVRDLLFHPNAISDDEAITDEMVRRYMMHFVQDDTI